MNENPLIIGDSAHNIDGLSGALAHIKNYEKDHIHFVLGFVNDKDISNVLALFPKNASYYFAKADIPRGLQAEELKGQANTIGLIGKSYTSVGRAFGAAKRKCKQNEMIFIGGSIFTLAEVL